MYFFVLSIKLRFYDFLQILAKIQHFFFLKNVTHQVKLIFMLKYAFFIPYQDSGHNVRM